MRNEILEALKTKFVGVSEAILNRIADKLAKTVLKEEQVTAAVEGVTMQQLLESYGDSRATEATQTAVANYEKKHGIKEGVKTPDTGGQGGNPKQTKEEPEEVPAWAKKILDENKKLSDKIANIEGEKMANARSQKLATTLAKAPEKLRERYTKDFTRMQFNDDAEFEAWVGEVATDVEAIATEYSARGVAFSRPKSGSTTKEEQTSPEVMERVKSREAEMVIPAIAGLPIKN